jgi:hypothetical protein
MVAKTEASRRDDFNVTPNSYRFCLPKISDDPSLVETNQKSARNSDIGIVGVNENRPDSRLRERQTAKLAKSRGETNRLQC